MAEDAPWLAALSPAKRRLYKIFAVTCVFPLVMTFITAMIFSPLIIIAWACVAHGERGQARRTRCESRLRTVGFEGNPDFYGVGIRIGVYLQWLSSLTANAFLPDQRRSMAGAYAAFSIALFIALLLLIFKHECAFTAEIIIMLNVIWGRIYLVTLSYTNGEEERKKKWRSFLGLKGVFLAFMLAIVHVSAWFWLRMASAGEADFVPTPSGTSFFLFAHVRRGGLEIASRFMAFLSIWISSTPVLAFIVYPLERIGFEKLAMILALLTPVGFLGIILVVYSIIFGYILREGGEIIALSIGRSRDWAKFKVNITDTKFSYW
jgi:hypothetical protein